MMVLRQKNSIRLLLMLLFRMFKNDIRYDKIAELLKTVYRHCIAREYEQRQSIRSRKKHKKRVLTPSKLRLKMNSLHEDMEKCFDLKKNFDALSIFHEMKSSYSGLSTFFASVFNKKQKFKTY